MSVVSPALRQERIAAAERALALIQDGMRLGLGTGSTAAEMIRLLGERVRDGLRVSGVPTSAGSEKLSREHGIPLITFEDCQELDLTIDGADEVTARLQLIKGGGGALLREKVVASVSRRLVIIVDSHKRVETLGRFPLPVEVVGFARPLLERQLTALGADVMVRRAEDGSLYRTDEGHLILDCHFGTIVDPPALARKIGDMPGVMEHGLFLDMADLVLVGTDGGVQELRREPPQASRTAPL